MEMRLYWMFDGWWQRAADWTLYPGEVAAAVSVALKTQALRDLKRMLDTESSAVF